MYTHSNTQVVAEQCVSVLCVVGNDGLMLLDFQAESKHPHGRGVFTVMISLSDKQSMMSFPKIEMLPS